MALDKVLHKIQIQIQEIAPTLELFVDESIQPSVNDCENLQKQLNALLENLAVYKFNKLNKEISPSFTIHAKLSAKEHVEEIKEVVKTESVVNSPPAKEHHPEPIEEITESLQEHSKAAPAQVKAALIIGLNDKFRFANELFAHNNAEFSVAIEQLNNLLSWQDSDNYLNSLKSLYDWKESDEAVRYFYSLVKKRFD